MQDTPIFHPTPLRSSARAIEGPHYQHALQELRKLSGLGQGRVALVQPLKGNGLAHGHFGELCQGGLAFGDVVGGPGNKMLQGLPALQRHLASVAPCRPLPLGAVRCLVDLPCDVLVSRASVVLSISTEFISVSCDRPEMDKTCSALKAFLDLHGIEGVHATINIDSNIPQGKGCGSSSADVVSVLRAGYQALGLQPDAQELGLLLCLSEGASNPVHLDHPVLFGHRVGFPLRELAPAWPRFHVLGFDPGGVVPTDEFEPLRYSVADLRRHSILIEALHHAMQVGSAAGVARVASQVAPADDRLAHDHRQITQWVREFGALGYAVSHSGVVAALLWPRSPASLAPRQAAAELLRRGGYATWSWSI